jgi:hypothetical protein
VATAWRGRCASRRQRVDAEEALPDDLGEVPDDRSGAEPFCSYAPKTTAIEDTRTIVPATMPSWSCAV